MLILIQGEMCENQVESDECTNWNDQEVIKLTHNIKNLSCTIVGKLMVTCNTSNGNKTQRHSSISMENVCCVPTKTTSNSEDPRTTDPKNTPTTLIQTSATDTMVTTQQVSNCKCPTSGNTESIGLGTLVGLLVVLLAIVTMGWMWTCWIMRKRASITTINTGDIR